MESLVNSLCRTDLGEGVEHQVAESLGCLSSHQEMAEYCIYHGIASIILRNLKLLGLENHIQKEAHNKLEGAFYRTLADNLQFQKDLIELSRKLSGEPIPLLVLKGPTLINQIYGDVALRPMDDIDLLVRPKDLSPLRGVLKALGYRAVHFPHLFKRGRTVFDLHTDTIDRARIQSRAKAIRLDLEAMWARARPIPDCHGMMMLNSRDQIVTLSVHALKHGFQRKIWLLDIVECLELEQTSLVWDEIRDEARERGIMDILKLTFYMIKTGLGRALPHFAEAEIQSYRPGAIERRLIAVASRPNMPQILEPMLLLRALGGLRQKCAYILEASFPRPEILSLASGTSFKQRLWLTYPIRLLKLCSMAVEYARAFLGSNPRAGTNGLFATKIYGKETGMKKPGHFFKGTALFLCLAILVIGCGHSVVQIRPPFNQKVRIGDGVKITVSDGTIHSGRVSYTDKSIVVIRTPRQTVSVHPVKSARFGTTIPWEEVRQVKVVGTLDAEGKLISGEEIRVNRRTNLRRNTLINIGLLSLATSFLIATKIQDHVSPPSANPPSKDHGKGRFAFWAAWVTGSASGSFLGYKLGDYLDQRHAIDRINRERTALRKALADSLYKQDNRHMSPLDMK